MPMTTADIAHKQAELAAILAEIEDDRRQQLLRDGETRKARARRRFELERELAAATGEEYGEQQSLDFVIGDEWHIISNTGGDPVVICGEVGSDVSHVIRFLNTHGFWVSTPQDELEESPLAGVSAYGLFVVRASRWKNEVVEAGASSSPEVQIGFLASNTSSFETERSFAASRTATRSEWCIKASNQFARPRPSGRR